MFLFLTSLFCSFCGCNVVDIDNKSAVENVRIERFDRVALLAVKSGFVDSMPHGYAAVLEVLNRVDSVSADSMLYDYVLSPAFTVFQPDVERYLPDLSEIEALLTETKVEINTLLPNIEFPIYIYGVVTPYSQSIVMSDSIMLLGLNHYLGADYPGYKGYVDDYMLKLKSSDRIVYDISEALIYINYPFRDTLGATVLSKMLYEGAVVNALLSVVPKVTLSMVLGYTQEQMKWANDNESKIWEILTLNDILYSIDANVISRLVMPAPATSIISQDAPGRLGRYMGYRMVESYIKKHPDVTVEYLLSPDFYASTKSLIESDFGSNK